MKRFSANPDGSDDDSWSGLKKKRRSRWADNESEKSILSGLPTTIPQGLTKEQEEQYLLQLQVEEITRRLRTGELGIPSNLLDRSPSPEPIYNQEGKRLNTREYRTRKKLEEDRHHLIQRVLKLNPDFKPPADYRPPLIRVSDRVNIPQEEHPEINFVGLLIGPRGNTLRNIEKETGTTIIIRGKGSVKEGKVGYKDGRPLPAQDEPLHAYITASSPENVKKAVDKIKQIIQEGITVPDAENDLRKQQLRELALLNGTLRENDALTKLKQYQEAQTIITNTILCSICGGAGHISIDCKQKRPGESLLEAIANAPATVVTADKVKMDTEYLSLMAELGQGPAPPNQDSKSMSVNSALPMLGVSRPILSLPAPNGTSYQVTNGTTTGATNASQSSFPPPSTGFVKPPLNLPPPTVPIPSSCWTPTPVPPPIGLTPPPAVGPPAVGSFNPGMSRNMPPLVPPPPILSGTSVPPPWQQFSNTTTRTPTSSSSGGSLASPAMMPPPPPPPFCSQPTHPWQQPMSGLRPVPPPMTSTQVPPPSWMPPPGMGGMPPPSYPPWHQHASAPSSTTCSAATPTSSVSSNSGSLPSGFNLPSNIGLPPPPPPPN